MKDKDRSSSQVSQNQNQNLLGKNILVIEGQEGKILNNMSQH